MTEALPTNLLEERLPDWYRDVSVDLSGELLEMRRAAIQALREELTLQQAPSVVAYAHGQRDAGEELIDWIRATARESDGTFAGQVRHREPQVMMACVVADHLATYPTGELSTALSLLVHSAAFRGLRPAAKGQNLVAYADAQLRVAANDARALPEKRKALRAAQNKAFTDLGELAQTGNAIADTVVSPWITTIVDALGDVASRVDALDKTFRRSYGVHSEALDQTAWLLDEYCEVADAGWKEVNNEGAALYAGFELAAMTRQAPGPQSAKIMLQSTLLKADRDPGKAIQPLTAVTKAGRKLERWPTGANATHHLAPLTKAVLAFRDADGKSWRPRAAKLIGTPALPKASEADVAMQAYRELLLARNLTDA